MQFNYLIIRPYVCHWLKQFSRFVLVGLTGAVVDFGIYLLLTRGFFYWQQHFVLASTISSLAAATNNFLWNRRWTFNDKNPQVVKQYVIYLAITLIYLAFLQFGLWFGVTYLHLYDIWAKVLALGVAVVIYFTILRHKVFISTSQTPVVEKL
jgi:putative flippase GtrA